jgi:glycine/D-amino acid oxidase-like deaminating enzyme
VILPQEADACIVGGGIMGLCAALALARQGVGVVVLDGGGHSGSTTNAGSLHVQMQSRFIRMETPARVAALKRHLPLYVRAVAEWQALAASLDTDIELSVEGGLMIAETPAQYAFLAEKCAEEQRLGLPVEMLDRAALERVAPWIGPAAIGAEFCAIEGKMNTLLANSAIERAVRSAGALLVKRTPVISARREGAGFTVETTRGRLRCGQLLLAAGGETGRLAAMFGLRVPVESEPLHMNITEPVAVRIKHLVQHADRQLTLKQARSGHVVIGGGRPATFLRGRPSVLRESMEGNLALAMHIAPWLSEARLLRTWGGVNAKTDGMPVLGAAPATPGLFLAVSGDAGYSLGPLSGLLLAEAMTGRPPSYPIGDFAPGRFGRAELRPISLDTALFEERPER